MAWVYIIILCTHMTLILFKNNVFQDTGKIQLIQKNPVFAILDHSPLWSSTLAPVKISSLSGWHSPCCTTGSRRGSSPCMEVLEKWWNTSHDVTLADFRRLLDGYSLFPNTTLLVRGHLMCMLYYTRKLMFAGI